MLAKGCRISKIFLVFFLLSLILILINPSDVMAQNEPKVGEKIGTFKQSDTKVLLRGKYIPTYSFNNQLCIIAEDLVYYGYNHIWNRENRTTRLYIGDHKKKWEGAKNIRTGGDIYYSDITIYIDGCKVPAYNIGGYSLVKLSDLENRAYNLYFEKVIDTSKDVTLKGKIELPEGEKPLDKNIIVTPVFYYFSNGYLHKYKGNPYVIPKGEKSVDYDLKIPITTYLNNNCDDRGIYTYIGYEIDKSLENYIAYDYEGRSDLHSVYLEKLNYYRDTDNDINIKVLPRQKVKMEVELTGDVFNLEEKSRDIGMYAIDMESNKSIIEEKNVSCKQNNIEFELDLVKGRKYKIFYDIKVFGTFKMWIPPSPAPDYPRFYYNQGLGELDENRAEIVEANEDNSLMNVKIKLPSIDYKIKKLRD